MENNWKECEIADLGTVITGKTPSTRNDEYWNGDIHFVTPKDIQGTKHIFDTERYITNEGKTNVKGAILPKGAVCVSCIGNIGYVGVTTQECVSNQQINSIIANEYNDANFIYYLMKYLWPYFKNYEGQSTALSILNKTQFSKIKVKVPSLGTQKQIAGILNHIDDKIELNNKINSNLHEQYVALVDNLISTLEEYKEKTLIEVADCQNGRAFYKEGYDQTGAFVVDLGNVNTSGNFIFTDADKYISTERYYDEKLEKYRIYKNDLVMVMTDRKSTMELLGKVGKIYKEGLYVLNQRMYRIRARDGINTNYLYACLNSTAVCNSLKEKALGTVQKYVNTGEINSIVIKVPSPEKMEEISSLLDPIFSQMENNILENEHLAELRDTLLPKLMSGELDVSDTDL